MSFNLLIGLGNTGTQIVKTVSKSSKLTDLHMFTIDSVTASSDLESCQNITTIPIISDDKNGSGRSRERGAAMFLYHDSLGSFNALYEDAKNAKAPIFIVTSSAGGTGSGVAPVLCKKLAEIIPDVRIVPIIVCPAIEDPDAFHMNTSDLMIELEEAGIKTYTIFRNRFGEANYTDINRDVAHTIELILGKLYDPASGGDSIDDSDLDTILRVPGRFIACAVESDDPTKLRRLITEKALHSFQPGWTIEETNAATLYTAFGLTSPFANDDFKDVFADVRLRIAHYVDEYRNICEKDGKCSASIIIAGLPHAELKDIDADYVEAKGIADGAKRSKRPSFLSNKSPINPSVKNGEFKALDKFDWTK